MSEHGLLKQIAEKIEIPAFHTRARNTPDGFLGDSFGTILARKIPDSLGSGLYLTSNIQDVIEWGTYKQERHGTNCDIYLYDLGKADNLKTFYSNEALDDHTCFLDKLTRYVLRDIEFGCYPGKIFTCDDKVFAMACEKFCHDNKLSVNIVHEWASDERMICLGRTSYDNLMRLESISTTFQKDILHINGIDTSPTIESDSVGLGSLVFDPEAVTPVYNFGSNTELARDFYRMVHDKIIDRKLVNIKENDREAIQDLSAWGYDSLNPAYSPEEYADRLYTRYKNLISEQDKTMLLGSFDRVRMEAKKEMIADASRGITFTATERTKSSER